MLLATLTGKLSPLRYIIGDSRGWAKGKGPCMSSMGEVRVVAGSGGRAYLS